MCRFFKCRACHRQRQQTRPTLLQAGHPRPEAMDNYAEARTPLLPTWVCVVCACLTPASLAFGDEECDLCGNTTPGDAAAPRAGAPSEPCATCSCERDDQERVWWTDLQREGRMGGDSTEGKEDSENSGGLF